MKTVFWVSSTATVFLLALLYNGFFGTILLWILNVSLSILACILSASVLICRGRRYVPKTIKDVPNLLHTALVMLSEKRSEYQPALKTHVVSINIDIAVQEIIQFVIRDYVHVWLYSLAQDTGTFDSMLQKDIWKVVENFSSRFSKIDAVQFTTSDIVTALYQHFNDIRLVNRAVSTAKVKPQLMLQSWLESDEKEECFLYNVADVLILYLFPAQYSQCLLAKDTLRDLLVFKVLKPAVDLQCDPDYINQTVLGYLEYRERLSLEQSRTFTYAASYEEFYKMIEKCSDVELLKQFRLSIITEIMHATTINNLKKAQGMMEKKADNQKSTKGNLLQNRNLKRYINQLTMSKSLCEKRIGLIGGEAYKNYDEHVENMPGGKVLSFNVVMTSKETRSEFMDYLKKGGNHSLLGFWLEVERMKHADKRQSHHMASEIFQMYISSTTSLVKLDRPLIKRMESFLMGDKGPEAFYEAQANVYSVLEKQYYPSFIVSDTYQQYVSTFADRELESEQTDAKRERTRSLDDEDVESVGFIAQQQSTYAKHKLKEINLKVSEKQHALEALSRSQSQLKKMEKLQKDIQSEIESLKSKRRELEFHIERTASWWENVGNWKAHVYNAEVIKREDKDVMYFAIVVDLAGRRNMSAMEDGATGWVITRNLREVTLLHNQLVQISPWLKKKELPAINKSWFKSVYTENENAKKMVEEYLTALLKDDRICQSEALYTFLSPSPDYLKQPSETKPKRTFSIVDFVKSLPSKDKSQDDYDDLLFYDEESAKDEQSKDSIATPLYDLIGEVFELRGAFKWLHKSLIVFVQVTFGRSINRQLRETVYWIFSESMLIYYLHLFRDSWWPNGVLAQPTSLRSDRDKLATRLKAKHTFLNSIPAVKNLVGEKNAREGAVKTFEMFQNVKLNKKLFYVLLELFLYELIPELKEIQEANKSDDELVISMKAGQILTSNSHQHSPQSPGPQLSPANRSQIFRFGPSK